MRRAIEASLVIVLVLAGAAVRLRHEGDIRTWMPDERVYTAQAVVIGAEAFQGVRRLVAEHNATPDEWLYPEPTRIGYLWPVMWTMKLTGYQNEQAGSWLSWLCSVLSLALLGWAGWRLFNPWIAAVAVLLADFCLPDLVLARRAVQDSAMELVGLAIVYLACEALRARKRLPWLLALSATGGYSLLIKDSSPGVFGFWLVWLAWALVAKDRNWTDAVRLVAFSAAAATLAVLLLLAAAGGLGPLVDVYLHHGAAVATNAYAVEYQSGPWLRYLSTFFLLSPVTTGLFVVGAGAAFLTGKCETALAAFAVFLLASSLVVPYFQNVRYLSPVYGAVYLVAGAGLWQALRLTRNFRVASALVCAALTITAAQDWREFERMWVPSPTNDLSVRVIVEMAAQDR